MGSLLNVYNSLGDVYEGAEIMASRPHVLLTLANLLIEYRLDKAYDIRLNHKHFDIKDGSCSHVTRVLTRDPLLSIL